MKIYISSYNNIRWFKPNMIPIATSIDWPYWLKQQSKSSVYVDKNGIVIGIKEPLFSDFTKVFDSLSEKCQKNCPYKYKAPNCEFMNAYYEYLSNLDFNKTINNFEKLTVDVKELNNYEGEPTIVLMVFESPEVMCSERPCLQRWFKDNGYDLLEWTKDMEDKTELF